MRETERARAREGEKHTPVAVVYSYPPPPLSFSLSRSLSLSLSLSSLSRVGRVALGRSRLIQEQDTGHELHSHSGLQAFHQKSNYSVERHLRGIYLVTLPSKI